MEFVDELLPKPSQGAWFETIFSPERRNDVRVEQEAHARSILRGAAFCRGGGSNSISSWPGICRASTILVRRPTRRRYSS
jgi:hypothetical protein